MSRIASPLRYPGGKSCLLELIAKVLRTNGMERGHYVEPYAGGCGLALSLLYEGYVSDIHINDLDLSIWAFWKSVLEETEGVVELIQKTPITIDEWYRQKEINTSFSVENVLALGFSTFFLNRTNRSGIIKAAGMIGGYSQNGKYKIDCRFNKEDLIKRIRRVAKYRNRIHLSNIDAIPFMKNTDKELVGDAFFCIDPPYFKKGSSLYTNFYGYEEHRLVAQSVLKLNSPWIVTYDNVSEIKALYENCEVQEFGINYSIQTKRVGSEIMISSPKVHMPQGLFKNDSNFISV